MTTSFYHITATEWDGGDLQCWNMREALGIVTSDDWKWRDAPIGNDGHLVSLATDMDTIDSVAYEGDIESGCVLLVTIPDEALTDHVELDWDDPDEDRVHITSIWEMGGTCPAALVRIPAKYIARV